MDAFQFIESPPKDFAHPVVVIYGDEPFLRKHCLDLVRTLILGEGEEDALRRLGGDAAELADVLDELCTRSLFGERRLMLVDDADDFVSRYREKLEDYVKAPSRWGTLVMTVKSWPSNTRLAKAVAKQGLPLQCKAPKSRDISQWLVQWCRKRYEKKLSFSGAALLVQYVGSSLGVLDQELQKLSSAAGSRSALSETDIERLAPQTAERTTWQMIDALAEGRTAEALHILQRVLAAGEEPMAILGALSWHLRNLARAGRLAAAGMPLRSALLEAGVKSFAVDRSQRHIKRLGRRRVDQLYAWLVEADLDLKGEHDVPQSLVLERLLVRLGEQ